MPEGMVIWKAVVEVGQQLRQLLREVVGSGSSTVALERENRHRIGSRGAANSRIDPPGEESGQDRERLRDLERTVVRKHHPAAADAQGTGGGGNRPDQRLGTGTGEHRPAMMLGDPVAVVAE